MAHPRCPPAEVLAVLYTVRHLTCQQIADQYGVSRQGVAQALKRCGVRSSAGERVTAKCTQCGAMFSTTRGRWRRARKLYCTDQCYFAALRNPEYFQWRQGQRIANRIVRQRFDLRPGMVVHHHDSDNRNNEIANLAVFASASDHTSYERGGDAKPIWDGSREGSRFAG